MLHSGLGCILAESQVVIINRQRDLHGKTLVLEKGATIRFEGDGLLMNGTVIGTGNRVEADKSTIVFKDI